MGNAIDEIQKNGSKKNSNVLLHIKLAKLRDYFASFKSICDNFSIDLSEFQHIFQTGQSSFVMWDTDNNGLVDSLQLFSGLAIFADTKLDDKIRFLFDVFDFNEVEYLQPNQLQFMIYCCVSASYKIFGITNQTSNDWIQDTVKDMFPQSTKLTVADLIKKGRTDQKVNQFFVLLKGQGK